MTLEEEINESNEYYLVNNQAVIYKKPTPIQIVSVDYPKRSRAVIKEAYFRQASTTDYNASTAVITSTLRPKKPRTSFLSP